MFLYCLPNEGEESFKFSGMFKPKCLAHIL